MNFWNIARIMKEKLSCTGLNLLQNNGEAAGQTVHHIHMHMIPRYGTDGKNINWIPGEASVDELEALKQQITE